MGDVKCENVFKHFQNNVRIATNEFASNLTANICLFFWQFRHYLIKSQNAQTFLLVSFEQVFYEILFV